MLSKSWLKEKDLRPKTKILAFRAFFWQKGMGEVLAEGLFVDISAVIIVTLLPFGGLLSTPLP